jgi:hypothetical protein
MQQFQLPQVDKDNCDWVALDGKVHDHVERANLIAQVSPGRRPSTVPHAASSLAHSRRGLRHRIMPRMNDQDRMEILL